MFLIIIKSTVLYNILLALLICQMQRKNSSIKANNCPPSLMNYLNIVSTDNECTEPFHREKWGKR